MKIQPIKFAEVLPFWVYKLWPGRHSAIESHSAMMFKSSVPNGFNFLLPVWYYGCFDGDKLIGVNSGHMCEDGFARSRGLWVDEEYRGKGYGKLLLQETVDHSKKEKAKAVWSYPRQSSWPVYESVGFKLASDWEESETSDANAYCLLEWE